MLAGRELRGRNPIKQHLPFTNDQQPERNELMTSTLNAAANSQARKSLASQIDRLDSMLDGLSDGLTEAVADAVKIAVTGAAKEAMQAAIVEILTNPEILAKMNASRPQPIQPAINSKPAGPTMKERFGQFCQNIRTDLANLRTIVVNRGRQLRGWAFGVWKGLVSRLSALWEKSRVLGRYKRPLVIAAGVGTAVAIGAWFAGPQLSAILSGVGGFVGTLAVH